MAYSTLKGWSSLILSVNLIVIINERKFATKETELESMISMNSHWISVSRSSH